MSAPFRETTPAPSVAGTLALEAVWAAVVAAWRTRDAARLAWAAAVMADALVPCEVGTLPETSRRARVNARAALDQAEAAADAAHAAYNAVWALTEGPAA